MVVVTQSDLADLTVLRCSRRRIRYGIQLSQIKRLHITLSINLRVEVAQVCTTKDIESVVCMDSIREHEAFPPSVPEVSVTLVINTGRSLHISRVGSIDQVHTSTVARQMDRQFTIVVATQRIAYNRRTDHEQVLRFDITRSTVHISRIHED